MINEIVLLEVGYYMDHEIREFQENHKFENSIGASR